MMVRKPLEFKEALDQNDYGLIISADGALRGIWIPKDKQGTPLPFAVIKICKDFYGVDPTEEDSVGKSPTVH